MPSSIGTVTISRREVARMVYHASRKMGWGRLRSARWAVAAWRRWPKGMDITATAVAI